jgi:hypothetical protein
MIPPINAVITETPTSTLWFDENGILCTVAKKGPQRTIEEIKKDIESIRNTLENKKICLLIDATDAGESSRETQDLVAEEFPKFVKALGVISGSALGRMLVNLFLNLKEQPYPTKMFNDEKEAKEWLKQFV